MRQPSATFCISRRAVLRSFAGAATLAASRAAAAPLPASGPPSFETARQQFRIVHPARNVGDFQMTRLDGSVDGFGRFRGKVVLLNFWATWCPPCRAELPILDRLQQIMSGTDVQVVAVSVDRGEKRIVERFVREMKIRHLNVVLDPDSRIAHSPGSADGNAPFALYGIPISYVINRAGGVEGYLIGEADWSSEAARNLLGFYLRSPPG